MGLIHWLKSISDINCIDQDGRTILHRLMPQGIGPLDYRTYDRCAIKVLDILRRNPDIDVNVKDKYGWTALAMAAVGGDNDIAKALLSRGADVNIKSVLGMTPLHLSVLQDYQELINLFIFSGADQNVKDDYGRKPLDPISPKLAGDILLNIHCNFSYNTNCL